MSIFEECGVFKSDNKCSDKFIRMRNLHKNTIFIRAYKTDVCVWVCGKEGYLLIFVLMFWLLFLCGYSVFVGTVFKQKLLLTHTVSFEKYS